MNGYNGSASLNSAGYNGMGLGGVGANGHTLSLSSLPRKPIDYPELSASISSAHQIVRPPPAAAAGALERQDNRMGSSPAVGRAPASASSSPAATGVSYPATSSSPSKHLSSTATSATISSSNPYSSAALTKLTSLGLPPPQSVPKLGGSWPPRYWADSPIGTSGLKNLGNTCYMNAPIQCLSATAPFARFFTEVDLKTVINYMNKMNSQGQLTKAFSKLVHDIWHGDMPYIAPNDFRVSNILSSAIALIHPLLPSEPFAPSTNNTLVLTNMTLKNFFPSFLTEFTKTQIVSWPRNPWHGRQRRRNV